MSFVPTAVRRLARPALALLLTGTPVAAQISLAGYDFDDAAAPDAVTLLPGSNPGFGGLATGCGTAPVLPGLTLQESVDAVMEDDGLSEWIFGKSLLQVDFVDNTIVNGPGPDLVVFEIGGAEGFRLQVFVDAICKYSHALDYSVAATGFVTDPFGGSPQSINAVAIDLDDFGIPGGASVRRLLLDNKGVAGAAWAPTWRRSWRSTRRRRC